MSRRKRTGLSVAEVRRVCAGLRKYLADAADAPARYQELAGKPWDPAQWDSLRAEQLMSDAAKDWHLMITLAGQAKLARNLDRFLAEFEDRHDLRPALRPVLLDPPAATEAAGRAAKKSQEKETA